MMVGSVRELNLTGGPSLQRWGHLLLRRFLAGSSFILPPSSFQAGGPSLPRWGTRLALPAFIAAISAGCTSGSLATNSGPRPPGHQWSVAGRQMVHVGEEVSFDFVLQDWSRDLVNPVGIADYCVAHVDGQRIEATPDVAGHFQFSHLFDQFAPGDKINVKATAFRQRAGRDFMNIRGEWLQSDSPYEEPDRAVCGDSVKLIVYQVPIELALVRPADDLDPDTGVLRIRRADAPTTSVFVDRPGRPGFTMTGPEPDGYYRISYQPSGKELNPTGTTDVEFTVYDTSGQPHHASVTLETP